MSHGTRRARHAAASPPPPVWRPPRWRRSLEPADARRVLHRIAEHTARSTAELLAALVCEPEPGRGARADFGGWPANSGYASTRPHMSGRAVGAGSAPR